ncbi:NAD(P)-dependent oxidoreductase, partial [Streptomyces sp. NPDC005180]|uniref:NAD(P)-dependent oxidoreductase n=1 Tax=Streptomyces sp. NPDC005180 TaxID=3156868 RepID=UPI0033B09E25
MVTSETRPLPNSRTESDGSAVVRALSYNIRSLRDDEDALARVIRACRPDLVFIQDQELPFMSTTVLVAGNHFIRPDLFTRAVRTAAGDTPLDVREIRFDWPHTPLGPVAEVIEASGSEDEMIEALRGAEICVTEHGPLTERILDHCPDLKLFCTSRGGPVNANVEAATRHGVAVCYAPGRNATATAEHTLTLLLAAARGVGDTHTDLRRGVWRGDYYDYDNCGIEIDGATVGLIGFGAIGSRVARILVAMGAHVLVHDPYVRPEALAGLAEQVSLDELLTRSRIVSLH